MDIDQTGYAIEKVTQILSTITDFKILLNFEQGSLAFMFLSLDYLRSGFEHKNSESGQKMGKFNCCPR